MNIDWEHLGFVEAGTRGHWVDPSDHSITFTVGSPECPQTVRELFKTYKLKGYTKGIEQGRINQTRLLQLAFGLTDGQQLEVTIDGREIDYSKLKIGVKNHE